jgi:hypothetical protein
MGSVIPEYYPIDGKTYSLFGKSDSTSGYYETIAILADKILELNPDPSYLMDNIARLTSKWNILKRLFESRKRNNLQNDILNLIQPYLKKYTANTEEHLKNLPMSKFADKGLATTREQYHLYMLEIELTNRYFVSEFLKADKRIALLPYCLQDFNVSCKSVKTGFDYQCRQCSPKCFQNLTSTLLKTHGIEPYIWTQGNMKKLAKYTLKESRSFGVLGIACIPELASGMRDCRKNNIPVIGIPLNANCCARWFGEFFPNSIDLSRLERMLRL